MTNCRRRDAQDLIVNETVASPELLHITLRTVRPTSRDHPELPFLIFDYFGPK